MPIPSSSTMITHSAPAFSAVMVIVPPLVPTSPPASLPVTAATGPAAHD